MTTAIKVKCIDNKTGLTHINPTYTWKYLEVGKEYEAIEIDDNTFWVTYNRPDKGDQMNGLFPKKMFLLLS